MPEFVADVADHGAVRLAQALSDVQRDHPLGVAGEDRWPIRQCFQKVKGRAALGVFRFRDHRQVHVLQGKQDPPLGGFDLRQTSYVLRPVEDRDGAGEAAGEADSLRQRSWHQPVARGRRGPVCAQPRRRFVSDLVNLAWRSCTAGRCDPPE